MVIYSQISLTVTWTELFRFWCESNVTLKRSIGIISQLKRLIN